MFTVANFKISNNIDTECLDEFLSKNANNLFMFHFT